MPSHISASYASDSRENIFAQVVLDCKSSHRCTGTHLGQHQWMYPHSWLNLQNRVASVSLPCIFDAGIRAGIPWSLSRLTHHTTQATIGLFTTAATIFMAMTTTMSPLVRPLPQPALLALCTYPLNCSFRQC